MATPTTAFPPPGTPLSPEQAAQQVQHLKRNISIALAITCPLLILLPPRKLDIYTFSLAGASFFSLNHLQKHRTGTSFLNYIGVGEVYTYSPYYRASGAAAASGEEDVKNGSGRSSSTSGKGDWTFPTDKAREYSAMVKEHRAREKLAKGAQPELEGAEEEKQKKRGILQRAWFGKEGEDWKEKRDAREKEVLESGEGVGKLIQDYFAEAVLGKTVDGEDIETDEQAKR